eukprot:TRINITY_DN6062_c0_g2_i1.p1 TRINITY_DN6062_c0_g2~~TRINITY_DN6062_c0_g2_i1.p1  ORF type:complete len:1830 (-),score=240.41 TRINITY_DN6062_c0_g2_i1:94-5583(-)
MRRYTQPRLAAMLGCRSAAMPRCCRAVLVLASAAALLRVDGTDTASYGDDQSSYGSSSPSYGAESSYGASSSKESSYGSSPSHGSSEAGSSYGATSSEGSSYGSGAVSSYGATSSSSYGSGSSKDSSSYGAESSYGSTDAGSESSYGATSSSSYGSGSSQDSSSYGAKSSYGSSSASYGSSSSSDSSSSGSSSSSSYGSASASYGGTSSEGSSYGSTGSSGSSSSYGSSSSSYGGGGSSSYGDDGSSSSSYGGGPFPDSDSSSSSYASPVTTQDKFQSHVCTGYDEEYAACPNLMPCDSCVPVNCLFDEWGEWFDAGGCSGIVFRQRGVRVSNNECGKPCDGPKIESKKHKLAKCTLHEHDAVWGAWSEWTACESTSDQSTRSRRIEQMNTASGKPAVGPTKETRACGKGPDPIDCLFHPWHQWTSCSATCGAGRYTRIRRVVREAKWGGLACQGVTQETKTCLAEPCDAKPCKVSAWTEWSSQVAHQASNDKQLFRSRSILTPPGPGGSACPSGLEETKGVEKPQARDCILSEWSLWSRCDKTCEGGQKMRHRTLEEPSELGGSCGHHILSEVAPCNTGPCSSSPSSDCRLSNWGEWSKCDARCGEGSKKRMRSIVAEATLRGQGCTGPLREMASCLESHCNIVDCRWGEWAQWSDCSCECGGGTKRRSRSVAEAPRNGGKVCHPQAMEEAFPCNTQACGVGCVDGQWGPWGDWTTCSASCSSSFRSRSRNLEIQPSSCGKAASGSRDEYAVCGDLPPCIQDRDCRISEWGDWSHCSCHCFGIRERNRFIADFATGRGKPCNNTTLKAIEPCNPGLAEPWSPDDPRLQKLEWKLEHPPHDCLGKPAVDCLLNMWEEWSTCSKSCGGGQRERRRTVRQAAKHGGRPCLGELTVLEPCNLDSCHPEHCTDCVWGPWDEWGSCSKCGGQRYRHRSIIQMPNHCGRPCDVKSAKQTSDCHSECGKQLFCAWTEWSGSTSCAKCGPATTMRNRALGFTPVHPGPGNFLFLGSGEAQCAGSQLNVSLCPRSGQDCQGCVPKHCVFGEWSEWHAPTCVGLCERERTIVATNNECGNPCQGPLLTTKRCPVECMKPKDCLFSPWGKWSACPLLQSQSQRTRSRSIIEQPQAGGKPCIGAIEETIACEYNTKQIDCGFGNWGEWTACSRTCGGEGWKERFRGITTVAAAGGIQCKGGMQMLAPCSSGPAVCPGEELRDCLLGEWGPWSAPGENHQQKRFRKIEQLGQNGGSACEGVLQETKNTPAAVQDCLISEWTEWDMCDKSCGGGQSMRNRQVHHFPSAGGKCCPPLLKETKGCKTGPCDSQDCMVSEWGRWGPCSTSCGAGQQSRSRYIVSIRSKDGKGCNLDLGETRACEGDHFCGKEDCKWGEWSPWSGCSCSCDGGQQTRTRHIARAPRNGGLPCQEGHKEEIQSCNNQPCDQTQCRDGQWGDWTRWAPCSKSCGGGITFRRRKVEVMANHCGKEPMGKDREIAFCDVGVPCSRPRDCQFSEWVEWSACSATCDGIRHRSRSVAVYGKGVGKFCMGGLKETVPCNPGPNSPLPSACQAGEPADCAFGEWGGWQACSVSCGGGEHMRSRNIIAQARRGGKPCLGSLTEIKECARHSCDGPQPKDCIFGEWEQWGACGKCSGQRKRFRNIKQYAEEGGKNCELTNTEETGNCPRFCHAKQYCGWALWGEWGECSSSCGKGYRQRRRHLELSSNASTVLVSKDLIKDYDVLFTQDSTHFRELLASFSAGGACIMAIFGAVRGLSLSSRFGQSRYFASAAGGSVSSRTFSRVTDGYPRSAEQNGDYLLVANEHETELPWSAPRNAFDELGELSS